MKSKPPIFKFENNWTTTMGALFPSERAVLRGKDVFSEFQEWDWLAYLYFSVTGKEPSTNCIKFLNGLYSTCLNFADPRIWNNRVAALAGTASSTAQLGVCAGSAVSEATIYGGPPVAKSVDFIIRAQKEYLNGSSIDRIIKKEIEKNHVVYGYGRPINKKDERVLPTLNFLKKLNLYDRPHLKLALLIEEELKNSKYQIGFNIGGVMAAFFADEGLTPKESYYLMVVSFYVGMIACYIDSIEKPVGALFPLRCSRISYEGADVRKW